MRWYNAWAAWFLPCLIVLLFSGPAGAKDLVLGMSAAFTGPSRGLGIELYRGSQAYFQHVNQAGGVHGQNIRILPLDDGYDPTPAIENTLRFLQDPQVLLLFNYVGTPTVTRVLPLLKSFSEKDFYLYFPFTGAQPQREEPYDSYVFNLRASYRAETRTLVDFFHEVGRDRIAVFYQADAYGRSGWDGVRRAMADHGLDIITEATYRRGDSFDSSMEAQAEIIAKARPNAIISVGSYAACAAFIRDARDAGVTAPIANLSFVGSENLLRLLQDAGREQNKDYTANLLNTQVVPSYEDLSLPAVREYRDMMDRYAPAPPGVAAPDYTTQHYSFAGFEGFLNAKVIHHALSSLSRTPDRLFIAAAARAVTGLDIGIDANVTFSDGDEGLDRVYLTTVQDGKFVPVRQFTEWR